MPTRRQAISFKPPMPSGRAGSAAGRRQRIDQTNGTQSPSSFGVTFADMMASVAAQVAADQDVAGHDRAADVRP